MSHDATPGYSGGRNVAKRKSSPTWTWDARVGRWRKGGRFARGKPPASALRQDVKGRYLDAKGRRVPARALPPKLRATGIARHLEPPKIAWTGERWTRGGKPSRAPKASELRRDAKGRLIDDFGRRVPLSQVRDVPVREVAPRIVRMSPGENVVNKEFASSKRQKARKPDNVSSMFERVVTAMAAKGPFSPDDVTIYQHGLKFVGEERLTQDVMDALTNLIPKGGSIKFADTKIGTEVYVFLGGKDKILDQAVSSYDKHQEVINRIYRELADYWGDIDWYVWAEFDEALYG